ncbi:amidase [Actinomadura meridiana]|uniref:Amidase n=1 Tax=Actinomadura meridiana TaxID=559626 RepID=A0ABP8CET5_9ACTN
MAELHDLTAVEQAAAVARGAVSPVELVDHYLDRIGRLDGELGAFVAVTEDAARARAREAERMVRSGAALPPLHGVPTAIKDLTWTAGVPTAYGSRAFKGFVPDVDAALVTALRAAGTISLGKTVTSEFALAPHGETDLGIESRNPWDTARSALGSSAGAASAVGAGLVPFAHASDGGGSIRIPAGACGLVGLKPSRGRVFNGPLPSDAGGVAVEGAVTRTVLDTAVVLDALAVDHPGALATVPRPEVSFTECAGQEPGRLRIGRYSTPLVDAVVETDCLAAYEVATDALVALGHEVVDIELPMDPAFADAFIDVWKVVAASLPVPPEAEPLLRPVTRWLRERGRNISATRLVAARGVMETASRQIVARTAGYDAVLSPTTPFGPPPAGWFTSSGNPEDEFARSMQYAAYGPLQNATGQPAISLPAHWTGGGLPIGVTLTGRPADEATLLRLGAQLEDALAWADRKPPVWHR